MSITKRFFVPDVHYPFQDPRAVGIALEVLKDFKPDELIILGDFFDCYSASFHEKDVLKNFRTLEEEIRGGRELIDIFIKASSAKKIVFLQGNHEARVDRWISTYASLLSRNLSCREILNLPKNVQWLPYGQKGHYKFENFVVTHGSIATSHSAASLVNKYKSNVICGHTHQLQEYHITNIHGEDFGGYTCGWLGDMERAAEYVKNHANWTQGFGVSYTSRGHTYVQLVTIINHKCVFNGGFYK